MFVVEGHKGLGEGEDSNTSLVSLFDTPRRRFYILRVTPRRPGFNLGRGKTVTLRKEWVSKGWTSGLVSVGQGSARVHVSKYVSLFIISILDLRL